jgi:hypothetical protein
MLANLSDACLGNPDATVQAILREHNVDTNSTTSKFITLFTNVSFHEPINGASEFD